jgi:hypothetical protein
VDTWGDNQFAAATESSRPQPRLSHPETIPRTSIPATPNDPQIHMSTVRGIARVRGESMTEARAEGGSDADGPKLPVRPSGALPGGANMMVLGALTLLRHPEQLARPKEDPALFRVLSGRTSTVSDHLPNGVRCGGRWPMSKSEVSSSGSANSWWSR